MLTKQKIALLSFLIAIIYLIWNNLLVDRRLVYHADRFHGNDEICLQG